MLHVVPDVLEEFSVGAGIDLVEHLGQKEWDRFNKQGVEKTRAAIHQRIQETSRQVTREIPQCPVTQDNVMVKVGNPVKQIVATAHEGNFDLIVMGTHGHGKLEDSIIGNIAGDVIRQSDIPVMVVRLPRKLPHKRISSSAQHPSAPAASVN